MGRVFWRTASPSSPMGCTTFWPGTTSDDCARRKLRRTRPRMPQQARTAVAAAHQGGWRWGSLSALWKCAAVQIDLLAISCTGAARRHNPSPLLRFPSSMRATRSRRALAGHRHRFLASGRRALYRRIRPRLCAPSHFFVAPWAHGHARAISRLSDFFTKN